MQEKEYWQPNVSRLNLFFYVLWEPLLAVWNLTIQHFCPATVGARIVVIVIGLTLASTLVVEFRVDPAMRAVLVEVALQPPSRFEHFIRSSSPSWSRFPP
jgi:hypothetical protein